MTKEEMDMAIARVILSTKRRNRPFSLLEVARDIVSLKEQRGSLVEVSNIIGISPGMLSQFLSVFKLQKDIQKLVEERKIDSVSLVYHLTKFSKRDQQALSDMLSTKEISSHELRALIPYRKQYPDESIQNLVRKIQSTKNIKISVLRFNQLETSKSIMELNSIFSTLLEGENVHEVIQNGEHIEVKLTKKGEIILRNIAKRNKSTFHEFVSKLIQ